jgi:hypothetical protein
VIGSGNSCNAVARPIQAVPVDANNANPPVSSGTDGYYTYTVSVSDLAANVTALPARTVLVDRAIPVMGGIQVPATIAGGTSVNFATNATDNLDLVSSDFTLRYPGPGISIRTPGPSLGATFDATLTTSASFSYNVPFFVRTLVATDGAGVPPAATPNRPDLFTGRVYDGAGNQSVPSTGQIQAANIPIPATGAGAQTDFSAAQSNGARFCGTAGAACAAPGFSITAPAAATNISNGGGANPANPTSVTLTAQANGTESATAPAFQFLNPFPAGLSFYYLDPSGEWILIGSAGAPTVSDNPAATVRTFTWSLSWDPPGSLGTAGAVSIRAIGVSSTGDGLASAVNANITLTP